MTNETTLADRKHCGGCKQWLDRAEFGRNARKRDGLQDQCRACRREDQAARVQRNRERNAALTLEQRQAGPPKKCSTCKQTLARVEFPSDVTTADGLNRICQACSNAHCAAWREENPAYYRENPHLKLANKYRQRGGTVEFVVTRRDLDRLWHRQGGQCAHCGVAIQRNTGSKGGQVDHIIPVSRGGVHAIGNLMYVCLPCNASKGNDVLTEWRIRKICAELAA